MDETDAFQLNINGVSSLIQSGVNKNSGVNGDEGVSGDYIDELELKMSDEELRDLAVKWTNDNSPYDASINTRAAKNKLYLFGLQEQANKQNATPIPSNILFEAQETFIPQALAKNPEPVVYSDNTPEGKEASNDLKVMLQFHATEMNLKRKLGMMVRHWSIYFVGVVKHGWDDEIGDITTEIRKPKNFILDRNGYIDEFGVFCGEYLGEKITTTASEVIKKFPKHELYITLKVSDKLGTLITYTEWWTDKYCFSKFEDQILDKHKNEFWNYGTKVNVPHESGVEELAEEQEVKGENHFAKPLMPYTFLSIFSLQEQPHDSTNLIEQNIANQDRILDRDRQIDKNLATNNNSIVVSDKSFNQETAHQAAKALQDGDPILASGDIDAAIKRIPANELPSGIMEAQDKAKDSLRGIFGVQGLTAQAPTDNTTAHGMVLNQEYDSTRIGGGIGDAIEATAKNIFNWWTQLYYVFYDEAHYAVGVGADKAVEYVQLQLANSQRKFIVNVAPNSMAPRDELSEQQNAINLADSGWLDPITLFQRINDPDPINTAKKVVLWKIDPTAYFQQFFPQEAAQQQAQQQANMQQGGEPPNLQGEEQQSSGTLSAQNTTPKLGQQAPLPKVNT